MKEEIKPENVRIHSRADELIACLEGEIAKRDARIAELEAQYQRDVFGLNNEGDPIGGDPAGGYANDNARLRAELAAIKAQEPVAYIPVDRETGEEWHPVLKKGSGNICDYKPLYAAPVSEAKAQGVVMPQSPHWPADDSHLSDYDRGHLQGRCDMRSEVIRINAAPVSEAKVQSVVMPERWNVPRPMWKDARQPYGNPLNHADIEAAEKFNLALDEVARLNAAPVQQVSVPVWMASARAFADRLYMAGWRDHSDAQHSGVAGMYDELLSSSPAAPAADAGVNDHD